MTGTRSSTIASSVVVETPTKLSKEQKAILEQYRATETGDECPASKGFFARMAGK